MDTKDTAEMTAPSVAPAKPAPAPKPAGEPEPELPVPSVPLNGLRDDSLDGLGVAFSGLSVGGPEGKEKEKEKQAVDRGFEEAYTGDGYGPPVEAPFEDIPEESTRSASDLPAVPSPTTTTLPAAHPDELLFWLVAKLPWELWDECRLTAERKATALNYEDLSVLLLELALEKESDQHLNAYCPGGRGSGSHGRGYQGHRPGQGTTTKKARIMSNVQDLFWCDARDEQGSLLHAPDCDQHDCFVVQGKKQETNTGGKAKLPNHYRCTITCAFCGRRKHYEDECYHKQRLSANLKTENASGKGGGKGNANKDNGQGKSKGNGKGQGGKGKVDEEAVTASLTKTRTRTRPERTQILRQGRTLSPLVGNPTWDLRPVPRRKANKKKGPSVLTNMGTRPMPASAPASCAWRVNSRRRGSK